MTLGDYPENGNPDIRKSDIEQSEIRQSENSRWRAGGGKPRWHLCVEEDGQLTAVLTGSLPWITVSGDSLASLRRQMRNAVLRGLL